MLHALLLSAELPPLRSGSVRLGASRPVLRDGVARPFAVRQPGLPTVLPGTPLPPVLEFSTLSATALHEAADLSPSHVSPGDLSPWHVSSAPRLLPEPAICPLSLKNRPTSGVSHSFLRA